MLRDVSPSYDVMFTLGIGKATCQWATPKQAGHCSCQVDLLNFSKLGMQDPAKSVGGTPMKATVLDALKDLKYLTELLQLAANFDRPVGCELLCFSIHLR